MKKVFAPALIIIALSFGIASAQTTAGGTSCTYDQVKQNYNACCYGPSASVNQFSCTRYTLEVGSQGTLNSGTQNTNPTNNQQQTAGTIAPTPQASAAALKSCSAIRFDSILDILIWAKCIISVAVIPLLFTLAFLFFLWGMITYIRNADDIKKREESKKFIYWGVLGLTVMVGVWGIVRIVTTTFGLGNTVPQLQTDCLTTDKNNKCK